jgi:hypothetical protein
MQEFSHYLQKNGHDESLRYEDNDNYMFLWNRRLSLRREEEQGYCYLYIVLVISAILLTLCLYMILYFIHI